MNLVPFEVSLQATLLDAIYYILEDDPAVYLCLFA